VYTFDTHVIQGAKHLGLEGGKTLHHMVKHSAPFTHPWANRRFEDWVFDVDGNRVEGIGRLAVPVAVEKQLKVVNVLCRVCWKDGEGCPECGGEGYFAKPVGRLDPEDLIYKF
jgi:hypothetical protein